MIQLHIVASAEKSDLFGVLGINWKLLVLQSIAFLIMLWVLKKFVYPPLTKALDERQQTVEAGLKAAKDAEEKAEKTQTEIADLLEVARKEASDIVSLAKDEANASIVAAETKAKTRAQRVLDQAKEQIDQDILKARDVLKHDTIELVAEATEKILRTKLNNTTDAALVEKSVKELR